jgi:oligosaccharide amylase
VPVYQPSGIVGNSQVLISIGPNGELMTFLYPHIDFPQNLHEGMPAVYLPARNGGPGMLSWTFEPGWEADQRYAGRTNILETRLRHKATGLALSIIDLVHPSEPMLLRRFEASNTSDVPLRAKLFQYLDPQLGELESKNAVHYHPSRSPSAGVRAGLAAVYWRNICFAVGAESLDEFGCGRAGPGSTNSAKLQMERGRLNRQLEEIGDVDLAMGWDLSLSPGESTARLLVIAAGSNEREAVARFDFALAAGWEHVFGETRAHWAFHVGRAAPVHIETDLEEAYYRCLLALALLVDGTYGSVLAAPEFDPFFERSGGYGYCWPRDAVEACLALQAAGYPEYMARFLAWARKAQRPEGYWEQRYWLSGERGPAWCTEVDGLQIDQTASVLFAMGRHARRLAAQARLSFLENYWESASSAASYLASSIAAENGLHTTAFDLWETFRGTFTYSNAAIAAALMEAAFIAREVGREQLASQWEETAANMKRAIVSRLWRGGLFARGLDAGGKLDGTADSSILGLVVPFQLLDLEQLADREMARALVPALIQRVGGKVDRAEAGSGVPAPSAALMAGPSAGSGQALQRFEGDQYAGGGPSAVTTLWLARVLLRLALASPEDAGARASYRAQAVATMRAALASGTSTGLLPEMMGPRPGTYWAVPHAWATASFVMAALSLDRLSAEGGTGGVER